MIKFKAEHVLLVFVLIVGLFLRTVNINSLPIFADESIYIRWAQIMRAEPTLRFLPLSDGKQPLYMWVVIPLFKFISDPLVAGRLLSAVCGVITMLGIYLSAQLLFKKQALSVLAAFLWAILPYSLFFERMALVDSMLAMFLIWTFALELISLTYSRLDFAMLAGFSLGFAYLTKSPAMFAFILIPVLLIMVNFKQKSRLQTIKLLALISVTYILAYGMYNILRLGPEFHMITIRNKDYVYSLSEIISHPWWPLIPHLRDALSFFGYMFTPVLAALSVWGIVAGRLSYYRQRIILFLWWMLPVIAQSAVAKTLTARYLLFTLPFAVILASYGLLYLWHLIKKPVYIWSTLALVLIPAMLLDYLYLFNVEKAPLPRIERSGYLEEWTAGTGLKEVSQIIRSYSDNGPVLVGSEGFFGTPFDALGAYLNDVSNVRIVGVGVSIDSVSEKLLTALGDNQVFLVVNSSRFHADPDKIGLKLLASYPKAVAPNGTQESLLFFQVLPRK